MLLFYTSSAKEPAYGPNSKKETDRGDYTRRCSHRASTNRADYCVCNPLPLKYTQESLGILLNNDRNMAGRHCIFNFQTNWL